jgi:hypothetical protein
MDKTKLFLWTSQRGNCSVHLVAVATIVPLRDPIEQMTVLMDLIILSASSHRVRTIENMFLPSYVAL